MKAIRPSKTCHYYGHKWDRERKLDNHDLDTRRCLRCGKPRRSRKIAMSL